MDEQAFRQFLTQYGKNSENYDELVQTVRQFEAFLTQRGGTLALATPQDLQAYTQRVAEQRPGTSQRHLDSIALYYEWQGNTSLGPAARRMAPGGGDTDDGAALAGSEISGSMPTNNAAGQRGTEPERPDDRPNQQGARTSLKDPIEGDDSNWGMDGR